MQSEVSSILVAAHELKEPLATLRQLAFAIDDCPDATARSQLSAQMVSVSDRALRTVRDLTKVARLDDAMFSLEPVAVRGVCQEVLSDLGQSFLAEDRELSVSFRNKSRLVVANRDLLYSIIYNFCANALHYSARRTRSHLSVSDHCGAVRVAVRDFGPALPTSIWRQLQSGAISRPTPIAMRPGSSGLGLFIASEFSRYMGARLGAIRHHDGTSFFLDLSASYQASLFS